MAPLPDMGERGLVFRAESPSSSALVEFRMNGVNFRVRQRSITPLRG